MPWTKKQKGLFGSDLARAKKDQKTKTDMSEEELRKALHEPTKRQKKGTRR